MGFKRIWLPEQVVVGDFNMPNVKWTPGPTITPRQNSTVNSNLPRYPNCDELFVECIRKTFFHQHITGGTRHRNGRFSTLDLLFTDEFNTIQCLQYLDPVGASDHMGIRFNILGGMGIKPCCAKKLSYNKGDYEKLRCMMDIDWDIILQCNDVQTAYDKFENILNDGISKCIPTVKIATKKNYKTNMDDVLCNKQPQGKV